MSNVTSVWSAYGHRFMSTDSPDSESCLTCGALYLLVPDEDDPTRGEYRNIRGDDPNTCTRDTSMIHGYPRERFCHEHADTGEPCEHTNHACNCLLCDS